jgi:lytic murein transglycosylase
MPERACTWLLAACVGFLALCGVAHADFGCRAESFEAWLTGVKEEAVRAGISRKTLSALDGLSIDRRVLDRDRGQPSLSQSFLEFAGRVVSADRLTRGRALLKKHANIFARIERDYGVTGSVLVAFWGLETDYGAFTGDFSSLRSLATLAYDCRRPEYFRAELVDALKLLESGDLKLAEMKGAWAGELGQVQFTPSNYLKYAVDYDGDGRRDLVESVPDALASTANYLKAIGWRANEPWLEEVAVADGVPWQEAARENLKPRSFWAAAGVTRRNGSALPADDVPAALLLPMGRRGPTFLGYANFLIFWEWNQSSNYSLAAAYFATRLGGAARLHPGDAPAILSADAMREVQVRLNALGYDAGEPDGRLGEITRAGVKRAQIAYGLPADGYPTNELLQLLRKGS